MQGSAKGLAPSDERPVAPWARAAFYVLLLLGPTVSTWGGVGHVELGRPQGWLLFGAYALAAGIFIAHMLHVI